MRGAARAVAARVEATVGGETVVVARVAEARVVGATAEAMEVGARGPWRPWPAAMPKAHKQHGHAQRATPTARRG